MHITRRQQWTLFAGGAAALAAPLASRAVTAAWRRATGEEPPRESRHDVDWGKLALWTVSTALATRFAQVAARQAAAFAWERFYDEAPPRRSRRRRRGRRRLAA
jgi:hypothetical protein